ncbi:transposase [Ancylomarina sp. YFZ004]
MKGFDYSQEGFYFITICCQDRACLFGKTSQGNMILNELGSMVSAEWMALIKRFPNIKLHAHMVMPNHFHGILEIVGASLADVKNDNKTDIGRINNILIGQPQGIAPTGKTVGDMMAAFKSITSVNYIRGIKTKNWKEFNKKLWQRNYWEHIIRNEDSFDHISEYILNNPRKWTEDKLHLHQPD